MESPAMVEDLQARLNEQEASTTETRTRSPSHEEINSDNDNGGSVDTIEVQSTSTSTPITLGDIQLWTPPLDVQFPIMQPAPWECIESSFPSPEFPSLDYSQEPAPFSMGVGLQITPMMHNDL